MAGGFKVESVKTVYMGSQHNRATDPIKGSPVTQIYGKVVRLKQVETFDPTKGWVPRG